MEAKIIYTSTHHVIREGDSYSLDLTGDGKTNLTFQNKHFSSCSTGGSCRSSQSLSANVAASAQAVHNYFGAVAMKPGMWIGPKRAFQGGLELMARFRGPDYGSWINVKNRYLGVKFKIKGQTHYGWARLSVQYQPPSQITATLTGYAYETIPGKAIIAGATKGPDDGAQPVPATHTSSTPEPATLGMLALGAPGLSIWRREEPVAATSDKN
jgi:hypothetical protein